MGCADHTHDEVGVCWESMLGPRKRGATGESSGRATFVQTDCPAVRLLTTQMAAARDKFGLLSLRF